jgi:hypothetical protein
MGGVIMATDPIEALLRRYVAEVFNAGNLAAIDELVAPNFRIERPRAGNPVHGSADLKRLVCRLRAAFPRLRLAIEELRIQGEGVIGRVTVHGAYQSPQTGIAIYRISDGKIILDTAAADLLVRLYHVHEQATGEAATAADGEGAPPLPRPERSMRDQHRPAGWFDPGRDGYADRR